MNWIETAKSSNLVWAILAICTFIGVPLSIYAIITGKRKKEFTYAKTTFQLVSETISAVSRLTLLYNDKPISDISVTRITVWNSGSEEIREEDLRSDQPLCIKSTENARILDASIIQQCDRNEFTESMNEVGDVTVDFECAEKKDGFVLQIIHTGDSDELIPKIGIKGGRKIRAYQTNSIDKAVVAVVAAVAAVGVAVVAEAVVVAEGVAVGVAVGVAAAVVGAVVAVGVAAARGVAVGAVGAGVAAGVAGVAAVAGIDFDVVFSIFLISSSISLVLSFISEYNFSIPSYLRKYVKVEIHP